MVPYLIEEKPEDYTLIDTCSACSIPTFESYFSKSGIDIQDSNRIVLTHLHPDHVAAVNEMKRKTGVKIYSHWIETAYLSQELEYNGPPNKDAFEHTLKIMGNNIDKVAKEFEKHKRWAHYHRCTIRRWRHYWKHPASYPCSWTYSRPHFPV